MRFAIETVLPAVALCTVTLTPTSAQTPQAPPVSKPPTVLFMCPHGAAKSVLASAYFQRAAKARGLNVRVESAGTDPDPAVSPAVAAHLAKNGYTVPIDSPRKVTADQLASADVVISMGCDLTAFRLRRVGSCAGTTCRGRARTSPRRTRRFERASRD